MTKRIQEPLWQFYLRQNWRTWVSELLVGMLLGEIVLILGLWMLSR